MVAKFMKKSSAVMLSVLALSACSGSGSRQPAQVVMLGNQVYGRGAATVSQPAANTSGMQPNYQATLDEVRTTEAAPLESISSSDAGIISSSKDLPPPQIKSSAMQKPGSPSSTPKNVGDAVIAQQDLSYEIAPPKQPHTLSSDSPRLADIEPMKPAELEAAKSQPKSPDFQWPAKGEIITRYGEISEGVKSTGINMAVPFGTEVRASEMGAVVYTGNELPKYGNMVIIKHSGGWLTAYGYLDAIKVKKGDNVLRSEVVGLSGSSGTSALPQVHFSIRKGKDPVNPEQVLQPFKRSSAKSFDELISREVNL
jgi:murein DD-endopeptidase MepM/ murein hydrolase activator NlpD